MKLFKYGISVALWVLVSVSFSKIETNIDQDISLMQEVVITLEDFENPDNGWYATTREIDLRRLRNGGYDEVEGTKVPGQAWLKVVKGYPLAMPRRKGEKYENCLGLVVKFPYPGKNFVYLIAPGKYIDPKSPNSVKLGETDVDNRFKTSPGYPAQPKYRFKHNGKYIYGIPLIGLAKAVSIWVHARGFDYSLEGWFMDWRGGLYKLDFGSLNYVGWRPHAVRIPSYIPQAIDSWPQNKYIRFIRFVIRSSTTALANEDVYFYFDEFRLLTDIYRAHFDGEELEMFSPGKMKGTMPSEERAK